VWLDAQEEVELELGELRRLLSEYEPLFLKLHANEPDSVEVLAIAALLHSFYGGIENIFKSIARGIDSRLPSGARWHADLLAAMRQSNEHRPAVIHTELAASLSDFLNFRHVFRHAYGFYLDWSKMSGLVADSGHVLDELEAELNAFFGEGRQ
jgi:hypothetical protein